MKRIGVLGWLIPIDHAVFVEAGPLFKASLEATHRAWLETRALAWRWSGR